MGWKDIEAVLENHEGAYEEWKVNPSSSRSDLQPLMTCTRADLRSTHPIP